VIRAAVLTLCCDRWLARAMGGLGKFGDEISVLHRLPGVTLRPGVAVGPSPVGWSQVRVPRAFVGAAAALGCALVVATPAVAQQATRRLVYSPFTASGGVDPVRRVTPGFGGECNTASFIVRGDVYRCFHSHLIRDPCYFDELGSEQLGRDVVLCVTSPWTRNAVRLRADTLDGTGPLRAGSPPWALELVNGRRCVFAGGATNVVGGRRLNYGCDSNRFLFGVPDTSRAVRWIRMADDFNGVGMHKVAIRVAWR
jgi:hypothetical protein